MKGDVRNVGKALVRESCNKVWIVFRMLIATDNLFQLATEWLRSSMRTFPLPQDVKHCNDYVTIF